ncbi:unnamed protein product [Closterium sp. NIES-54]
MMDVDGFAAIAHGLRRRRRRRSGAAVARQRVRVRRVADRHSTRRQFDPSEQGAPPPGGSHGSRAPLGAHARAATCGYQAPAPPRRCISRRQALSSITVITGRGKHSASGQANIKPAERGVGWQEQNAGSIRITRYNLPRDPILHPVQTVWITAKYPSYLSLELCHQLCHC